MKRNKQQIFGLYYFAGWNKITLSDENNKCHKRYIMNLEYLKWHASELSKWKLILRPFSDMTKEEKWWLKGHGANERISTKIESIQWDAEVTFKMLEWGICLNDEWFENGTAVNRKDLK